MPELGSKISLISKADIRYEGRLYTVDPQECTIALSSVRSFGTEDRETQFQIAPQSQIYDYILFRGSDIKDIRVVNNSLPHPNDPAIMQVQLPNGQHIMPHFPMPSMNPHPPAPPMGGGAYGNPFGSMGGLGGMTSAGPTAASSLAPGSGAAGASVAGAPFMLNNQQQHQHQQNKQQQQQQQQKQPNLLAGASRSTTPISLISRKSPSGDLGVQLNQQQQQPHQQHHQNISNQQSHQNNATHGGGGNSRDAGHKRQNHHQPPQQRGRNTNNNQRNNANNSNNEYYNQGDRRHSSGRNIEHYNNQHDGRGGGGGGGGANYDNQRNNQVVQNRAWTMHRGQNNTGGGNMRNRGGGGARGRMSNQGYRPISGGPGGNQNKPRNPKNTIKFDQDYDFEQANHQFEELRSQLTKLKINGEAADKKDDSGNETGAGDHEPEEEEITVGYDKTKSFFDNISCEAAQDRSKNKKNDWRQERKLNSETFGVSSTRRGGRHFFANSYRGRGNYYNRNMGNYGFNRYRGGSNYNRNRNNSRAAAGPNSSQNNPGSNMSGGGAVAASAVGSNDIAALKDQQNPSAIATTSNAAAAVGSGAATSAASGTKTATTTQENNTHSQMAAVGAGQ